MLKPGAAFDEIRAAVNLVLAGALVALGTSLKLPLSTTYVTFMVAMGTSLADRAWGRESAVFRITGVLSVIGGWFITAGVAFILSFLVSIALFFGSFLAMAVAIALAIFLLVRSNMKYRKHTMEGETDKLFTRIVRCDDKEECWTLLREYLNQTIKAHVRMVAEDYEKLTTAFFCEDYRRLKHVTTHVDHRSPTIGAPTPQLSPSPSTLGLWTSSSAQLAGEARPQLPFVLIFFLQKSLPYSSFSSLK